MFSIIKCHKCGRIFVYYGERKTPHCPNARCHTMVTISDKTILKTFMEYCNPNTNVMDLISGTRANRAYIYLQAFNNEVEIVADVYSTDGHHFVTIPLNSDKLQIITKDLLECIPDKSKTFEKDGRITIRSGRYIIKRGVIMSQICNQSREVK